MVLLRTWAQLREAPPIKKINRFINSKYMLVVFALLAFLTNVFALELWIYPLMGLYGVWLCLFGEDMLSLGPAVAFVYISPSLANNMVKNPDSVFYPQNGLWLFIGIMVLFVTLFLLRLFLTGGFKKFIFAPRKLLLGYLLLGAALLLGGVGYEEYTPMNLLYVFLFFGAMFILYLLIPPMVNWKKMPKDYFAWTGMLLALTVAAELVVVYFTNGVIDAEGAIDRSKILTGWGQHNTLGVLIAAGMPGAFYLATKKKYGFVFSAIGTLLYVAVVATNSRGSILFGGVVYLACVVMMLIEKKNRLGNGLVFLSVLIAVGVLLIVFRDHLENLFSVLLELELDPLGRDELFRDGLDKFLRSPLFGSGFFSIEWGRYGDSEMTFLPYFWHNTFIQWLGACGILGLAAYLFHRWQTVLLLLRKPSREKNFIAACVGAILLTSLLDCHLFNIGVTFVYSVFLLFAEKSEESETEREDDLFLPLLRRLSEKVFRRSSAVSEPDAADAVDAVDAADGSAEQPEGKNFGGAAPAAATKAAAGEDPEPRARDGGADERDKNRDKIKKNET